MKFTIKTRIEASAKQIYSTWLDSKGHTNMTGGEAKITDKIGDQFTAWDGYISGENVELDPNKRILQSWRTTQFLEHEENSQVEILFKEVDGGTELTLIHSKLSDDGGHYKQGWKDHYFDPMMIHFSK